MPLFTVDEKKCNRDGICVAVCPAQIIQQPSPDDTPRPTADAEDICIQCGHCVAVCPHGALSHRVMASEACTPLRKEWNISADQAVQFLKSRRSIRMFKPDPVPREGLTQLIDLCRWAPSGHNSQPLSYLVIENPAEVKRLAGLVVDWMKGMLAADNPFAAQMRMDRVAASWEAGQDRVCREAPHVVVVHAPKNNPFATTAGPIALTYLELAAKAMGLGTCWGGYFNTAALFYPPMTKELALPEGHTNLGAMMVGYPRFKFHRLPQRKEATVTWR
jgi:nitroreductase/NAD-dependent dihydropyrimidine dehydrogenase PreA subunit